MMHQSARHEVLSTLGVKSWYCKYTISNAAITPAKIIYIDACVESPSVKASAESLVVSPLTAAFPNTKQLIKTQLAGQSAAGKLINNENITASEPVKATDEPDVVINIVPRLTLSMIGFGNVVIIFEKSESSDGVLERVLLENIISVFSRKKIESKYDNSTLSWPVFKSQALIEEQSLYFEPVARRWLRAQSWSDCDYVIYLGNSFSVIESALLGMKIEQGLNYMLLSYKGAPSELLGSPIKKKGLWPLFSQVGAFVE